LPATQATQIALPPNGETILIRSMPEITERELVAVEPDASGAVHLRFNHEGQINLDAVTAQNQGRIMVVMLNGTIIYAPVIDEQLSNGELVLPHPLPPQVVQLLQDIAKKNVEEHART
jgi:preprotein translocase subunit SecD